MAPRHLASISGTLAGLLLALIFGNATPARAAPFAVFTTTPPGDGTVRTFRGGVEVVDLATLRRVGSPILLPGGARTVLAARLSDRAYVATRENVFTSTIAAVSLASGTVLGTFAYGEPGRSGAVMALSPDERTLYVFEPGTGLLDVVDTATMRVVQRGSIGFADTFALSVDGRQLYVPYGTSIKIVDAVTLAATSRPYPGGSVNVVPDIDGRLLYVVNADASVTLFDPASGAVTGRVTVGAGAFAAVLSADGAFLYVGNGTARSVSRVDTRTMAVSTYPVPVKPTMLAVTPDGTRLVVSDVVASSVWFVDAATGAMVKELDGVWLPGGVSTQFAAAAAGAPFGNLLVEFHHAGLDHYFMTADGREIADLDDGIHAGWKRTGEVFHVWRAGESAGTANPVCRFYGLPAYRLNSHFYSAIPQECDETEANYGGAWLRETDNAFELPLPDVLTGACPSGTDPVYRLWNQRIDSNHRYTARNRYTMIARGWVAEGYGPLGVAMCARR